MLFKESVAKLSTWMRQNVRTDPELAYWIEKYLLFHGTRSFTSLVAEDNFALTDIRVAAVGQDLIGWTEFLHGKVSVEIASIQNLHCMSSLSCRLTGTDWMKAFISQNININYLINYHKSYHVRFGQTRVFLIAVCEHSKAAAGQLENPQSGFSLWYQSNRTPGSSGKPVTG
jgi:hypothetical protein